MYLRIESVEGRVFHVTSTSTGFYVNKTQDTTSKAEAQAQGVFDPTPATPSYFSRTLWALLSRTSAGFKKNYQALLTLAASGADSAVSHSGSTWDAAFALSINSPYLLTGGEGQSSGDASGAQGSMASPALIATEAGLLPPYIGSTASGIIRSEGKLIPRLLFVQLSI
jgi:hypothetical protein